MLGDINFQDRNQISFTTYDIRPMATMHCFGISRLADGYNKYQNHYFLVTLSRIYSSKLLWGQNVTPAVIAFSFQLDDTSRIPIKGQ